MGRYCNEKHYADLLEHELKQAEIIYSRELILQPSFSSEHNGRNKIDFLIENKIVIELKCKKYFTRSDYFQPQRYLKSLNLKLCILVNFSGPDIITKRILNSSAPI